MRRRTQDDLSLRAALRELPQRDPPAGLWQKIETELDARSGAGAGPAFGRAVKLAIAASIVLGAIVVFIVGDVDADIEATRTVAGYEIDSARPSVDELVAESVLLERTLFALPRYDGVVRVGAAGTIAGLEDHIAWIDAELSAGEALGADPSYREALWQERVDLMNALVDVQYAQFPARALLQ